MIKILAPVTRLILTLALVVAIFKDTRSWALAISMLLIFYSIEILALSCRRLRGDAERIHKE